MKKILIICLVVLTACNSKPTTPFQILKSVKSNGGAKMDVLVKSRITKQQMIAIAATIKSDSSQYNALQIDYLLPGSSYKNAGGVTVYATITYHNKAALTGTDTVEDADKNLLSFQFVGFTPEKAKHLLSIEPEIMGGKTALGKFIDDNTQTITIIYEDKSAQDPTHILELDSTGKVISAIVPMEITDKGVKKMVVSQQGDYMTLKDSVLTLYSSEDLQKPYRSIKQGI
ncbi:MAG TPA: hypothetical protein VL490_03510 [Mucilaginibacter sp.]|jgi:hypothetical protein|nr:hypothetical protein [Mucilaginibacter sp.]